MDNESRHDATLQVHTLMANLAVAAAERDYRTAVSLLGVGQEVLAVISRDADLLAREVRMYKRLYLILLWPTYL